MPPLLLMRCFSFQKLFHGNWRLTFALPFFCSFILFLTAISQEVIVSGTDSGTQSLLTQSGALQKSEKEIQKQKQQALKDRNRRSSSGIYSIKKWYYRYEFGKPDYRGQLESVQKFDSRGDKIQQTVYNRSDGSVAEQSEFKYDRDDNLVENVTTKNGSTVKTIYRYDSLGAPTQSVLYKPDGSVDRKTIYLRDGTRGEIISYLSDGRLYARNVYLYDTLGDVVEMRNSINKFIYSYDSSGSMVEMEKYNRDFTTGDSLVYRLSDRLDFMYDSSGFLTGSALYDSKGEMKAKSSYINDSVGNVLQESEEGRDGVLDYQKKYVYDNKENLLEDFGADHGRKFRDKYAYDNRGDLTEWVSFDQVDEPEALTKFIYERYSHKKVVSKPLIASEEKKTNEKDEAETDTSRMMHGYEDLYQYLGCRIIASDGVYLGLVWADTTHPHSILNESGPYGFEESPTSIFNPKCPYGGINGVFSPFNAASPSPPSLYREGKFVSYLTKNPNFSPRVSPDKLMTFLTELSRKSD
jgi:hypothetical protein